MLPGPGRIILLLFYKIRCRYAPTKLALPESEADNLRFGNGHGLARDRDGNIYFTFDPKQVTKTTQVARAPSKVVRSVAFVQTWNVVDSDAAPIVFPPHQTAQSVYFECLMYFVAVAYL